MPGPSKNYEMTKFFSEKYGINTEFWICGFSHYISKMNPKLKGFKLQYKKKENKHTVVFIKSTPYKKNALLRQLNIMIFDFVTAIKILFSKNIGCVIITVPPISIFNILALKLRGIKIITDVEDLWPLFLEDMGMNNKVVIKYMDLCSKFLYKNSDGIAAVSEGMLKYVDKISKSENKWISPLGVNVKEYFNIKKNEKLIEDKIWKNDFKIMYLGVQGRANDLLSVLKTIEVYNKFYPTKMENKSISFIFIGNGDQTESLIKYRDEKDLKNVYFEKPVSGDKVSEYLVHADICLTNLMKIESFKLVRPNKLFQYMALGKPIITGIWGEFQEIVEKVNAGIYVDFTDKKNTSKKIYDLINDNELIKKMGINGKHYIEEYGDREKIFSSFYDNILKIEEK